MKRCLGMLLLFLLSFSMNQDALAVFGGKEVIGSPLVVSLVNPQNSAFPGCSGALIAPQIVVSAAHCLGNHGKTYEDSRIFPTTIFVTMPGVHVGKDSINSRVQVLMAVVNVGYTQTFDPVVRDYRGQYDDIAFYFLEKPLVSDYAIDVATMEEIDQIRSSYLLMDLYGYGLQKTGVQDGKPYMTSLQPYPDLTHFTHTVFSSLRQISAKETGDKALCGGDSGGPWYGTINEKTKLIAVTSAASGCVYGNGEGNGGVLGALVAPNLYLVDEHFPYFISHKAVIALNAKNTELAIESAKIALEIAEEDKLKAKSLGTYLENWEGCGNQVSGYLQIRKAGSRWEDFVPVSGWVKILECVNSGQPFRPWADVSLPQGVEVRWRLFVKGSWEVFSSVKNSDGLIELQQNEMNAIAKSAVGKAAAELKAKQEAEAKAAAELKAKQEAEAKAAATKKTTISCLKGKLAKKVTAIKPVCPKGYRKKASV